MVTQRRVSRLGPLAKAGILGGAGMVLLSLAGVRWGPPARESAASGVLSGQTVVVAARSLDVGVVLHPGDVTSQAVASTPSSYGAVVSPRDAVGRRLLIALPSGSLLTRSMLSATPPQPGRRQVRIAVDGTHLDPAIGAGSEVEVLAAVDGGATLSRQRVVVIGIAHVEGVGVASTPGLPSNRARELAAGSDSSPAALVTLECDDAEAARLIWAESFARGIRLLVRSPGDPDPAHTETNDAAIVGAFQ